MLRASAAFLAGLFVTLSLFYFMSRLITGDHQLPKTEDSASFIEFVRLKSQDQVETRQRKLPEKPPEPKETPRMDRMNVASADVPTQDLAQMNIPAMDLPLNFGGGPLLGGAAGGGGSEVMPLVRMEPQYPRKAAMMGVEGWVVLQFDITPAGTVSNVRVMDSHPRRIFDRSARRALLKWKYRPKVIEGKPIVQEGLKVKIDFKLES
ncbi:MAG: energy transducer TonB [Bdellovibrionaceae bacterium]|nr:energy transducer TonB [Bdellovibrionales bacterium]MCB9083293.1 energy transducer TonB [Pseudobdellovibrionaceae bacterium]